MEKSAQAEASDDRSDLIQAYFDASCKSNHPNCQYIVLAGYMGTPTTWRTFSDQWRAVLVEHGAPTKNGHPYFHATDAFGGNKKYSEKAGWAREKTKPLAIALLNVLGKVDRRALLGGACAVNLADCREVSSQRTELSKPEVWCIQYCLGAFALGHPDRNSKKIELIFDRDEGYYEEVDQLWKREVDGKRIFWAESVSDVKEVEDMCSSYPLQAADLLAWVCNRYHHCGAEDTWGAWYSRMFIAKANYATCVTKEFLIDNTDSNGRLLEDRKWPNPPVRHGGHVPSSTTKLTVGHIEFSGIKDLIFYSPDDRAIAEQQCQQLEATAEVSHTPEALGPEDFGVVNDGKDPS